MNKRKNDVKIGYMDIYSPPGTKVIFAHPDSGTTYDQEKSQKHLTEEIVYTVKKTEVQSFKSDVILEEIPGIKFNTVMFSEYDPNRKEKI